jgi:hypothetical protein
MGGEVERSCEQVYVHVQEGGRHPFRGDHKAEAGTCNLDEGRAH